MRLSAAPEMPIFVINDRLGSVIDDTSDEATVHHRGGDDPTVIGAPHPNKADSLPNDLGIGIAFTTRSCES